MDGRYRVERVIGQGAFGRVYLAHDSRLRRNVAIKELLATRDTRDKTDSASYASYLERFQREAHAGGVVTHPNIVSVHELAIDADENRYLVMEYVDGTSLRQLLDQVGTLPVDRAVRIALDIARALDAVHEHDIVHRDLKPSNIMVSRRGVPKVADFGIAQAGHESQRTHATTSHPGTPLYMAPEQRSGSGYLDGRADLYSLGAILYEMLVGKPYGRRREPLATIRPDLPLELIATVNRLLASDPENRYQNASDVVAALEDLVATRGDASQAFAPSSSSRDPGVPAAHSSGPPPSGERVSSPPGVPVGYRGTSSDPPPGVPIAAAVSDRRAPSYDSPRPVEARRPSRLWPSIGIGAAAVVIALIAVVALTQRGGAPLPTATAAIGQTAIAANGAATAAPTPTSGQSSILATPTGAPAAPSPTLTNVAVTLSPVPDNTYVVADARNAITYAFPKEWRVGGVSTFSVNTVVGFTVDEPYAFVAVGVEDVSAGTTLDAYTDGYLARQFRVTPDWKPGPINRKSAQLAGQDARVVDFLQPSTGIDLAPKGGTVYQYQMITLHDNRAWLLAYATAIEQKDAMVTPFDVLARTFAFCPLAGCSRPQTLPTIAPGKATRWADGAKLVTLDYPADWYVFPQDRAGGAALLISNADGVFLRAFIFDQPGTLDQEVQRSLDSLTQSPDYLYSPAPATNIMIGGEAGRLVNYTYALKKDFGAKPRDGAFWITNRGGKEFLFSAEDIKQHRAEIDRIIGTVVLTGAANVTAVPPTPAPIPAGGVTADLSKWPKFEQPLAYRQGFDAASGEYRVVFQNDGKYLPIYDPNGQRITDFTLEVDVRQVSGKDGARYGLIFRSQPRDPEKKDREYYLFAIDSQGRYTIFYTLADGTFSQIVPTTSAPDGAFKTGIGAVNHLTVTCKGDKITIAVNDKQLATATATLMQPGAFGLYVESPTSNGGIEVGFKNLRLSPV